MSNNAPDYENNLAFDPDINTMPRCDIEALKSEIKRLKVLLLECRKILEKETYDLMVKKIDNAIGEKQPSFKDYITEDQLKQLKGGKQ